MILEEIKEGCVWAVWPYGCDLLECEDLDPITIEDIFAI